MFLVRELKINGERAYEIRVPPVDTEAVEAVEVTSIWEVETFADAVALVEELKKLRD